MSKHDRIKQERASKPPGHQGWTANASGGRGGWIWWGGALVAIAAVAGVIALAFGKSGESGSNASKVSSGSAPAFSEQDVMTGEPITSTGLRGKNVLLFFSEGVMCEACFEQIQSLEQESTELRKRGLTLINITTDPSGTLQEAVQAYGIRTPMISDESHAMSTAYGAIGQGMHPDTDGHTFVLIDRRGKIRWRKDYTTMYVPPDRLFEEIPGVQ